MIIKYIQAIIINAFFICIILLNFNSNVSAAINRLDRSFGVAGKVSTSAGSYEDFAYTLILQDDGKIVAGGSISNASNLDFGLARYNSDGTLDDSFNYNGIVVTSVGSDDDAVRALALQEDGKIIAAGYTSNGLDKDLAMVRYLPDGSIDRDFGLDGIVVTSVGNSDDEIVAVHITRDEKILIIGNAQGTSGHVAVLSRYLLDGSLDVSFGEQGIILLGVGHDTIARSLGMLPDGKIVIGGVYSDSEQNGLFLARYFDDGSIDTSFGDNGLAVPAVEQVQTEGFGLQISDNDFLYIAGSIGEEGSRDTALFRFDINGSPDETFGDNGVLVTKVSSDDDVLISIAEDEHGIGAAGYTVQGGERKFLFIYFSNKNQTNSVIVERKTAPEDYGVLNIGTLMTEKSFQDYLNTTQSEEDTPQFVAEVVTTDFGNSDSMSFALAVQSDGKMVAAGYTQGNGASSFALARYTFDETNTAVHTSGTYAPFIETKALTKITAISAISGGIILPGTRYSFTKRGIVFSIAPDPIYIESIAADTSTDTTGTDTGTGTDTDTGTPNNTVSSSNTSSSPGFEPFGSYHDKYVDQGYTEEGAGPGSYSSFLDNLRPGTVYYIRAYTVSSTGSIFYGNQLQFDTADACFVATAAYGSFLHPYVSILRTFRDTYMIPNATGKFLVDLYYNYSPDLADKVQEYTVFRYFVRIILFPVIAFCWLVLNCNLTGMFIMLSVLIFTSILYKRHYAS